MDDSSSLSRLTPSVTSDKMNPNKKLFPEIRKFPKEYHGDKVSDTKKLDLDKKESDNDSAFSRTISGASKGNAKFSPNDNKKQQ